MASLNDDDAVVKVQEYFSYVRIKLIVHIKDWREQEHSVNSQLNQHVLYTFHMGSAVSVEICEWYVSNMACKALIHLHVPKAWI